jgi:uncharacterized protein (DUF1330 family)
MPAYWVARARIDDPVRYKKYTDLVPPIIARHDGKVLARGGKFRIMEGSDTFRRFIVIEFPTFEQAVACFESQEYQEAAAFRKSGGDIVENVIVDGGDATPR